MLAECDGGECVGDMAHQDCSNSESVEHWENLPSAASANARNDYIYSCIPLTVLVSLGLVMGSAY